MIDWLKTKAKYGYGSLNELIGIKRPTVVCSCVACHKTSEIKLRTKKEHIYKCPSCVGLERSSEISLQVIANWKEDDYRNKQVQRKSEEDYKSMQSTIIKQKWQDPKYRKAVLDNNIYKFGNASKENMAKLRCQQPRISSIQNLLYTLLDDLKVDYIKESDKTRLGHYVFDCLVPIKNGKKLLIEVQGDYWHIQDNVKRSDRAKFTYIERYFPEYEIMYIWEHEFRTKEKALNRLKAKLDMNINIETFSFDDIDIKDVTKDDLKSFLNAYHYIGKGRGGKTFGAYLNDKLVACVVFSPPLRQNLSHLFGDFVELSRFCIHPSYQKKNFASWLISRTIKQIKKNIVAYSDTTVGHYGTIYKASNFKLLHEVEPDYWYTDKEGFVMHKKTLYGLATRTKMTESEYSSLFGYVKKYGGKKFCYIYGV